MRGFSCEDMSIVTDDNKEVIGSSEWMRAERTIFDHIVQLHNDNLPNKANVVCIDNKGGEWMRHRFGVHGLCERCGVIKREWDKTAARRQSGKRLAGCNGKVVELGNETN